MYSLITIVSVITNHQIIFILKYEKKSIFKMEYVKVRFELS